MVKGIDVKKNSTILSQGIMVCKIEESIGQNGFVRFFYDVLKDQVDFGFKCPFKPVSNF